MQTSRTTISAIPTDRARAAARRAPELLPGLYYLQVIQLHWNAVLSRGCPYRPKEIAVHLNRRNATLYLLSGLSGFGTVTRAQQPGARLRILCGYPPGGSVDIVCRKLAERLAQRTGATTLVDNRPGAAGRLAVLELVKASADARHLLVTPASILTMYPHVYPQLGYDVFVDLQPVCTVAATAFALAVGPTVPGSVTDLPGFVAWCNSNPALAQCGNAGAGSMPHFMAILFAREMGLALDHIPYRGGGLAMQAAAAGEVSAAMATESAARALHAAGKVRVLATSGVERTTSFPGAPTFGELGAPALVQREWFGVFAPAATPSALLERTADDVRAALRDPAVRETWDKAGLQEDSLAPEQLRATLRREHEFWGPVIRASGFRPES